MAKITTPDSLYGNSRDILREAERENEILAGIVGEEYESPGDIPKGKYVIEKRLLDAAQKKNELLEAIADGGGAGVGANKLAIDYATDVLSLKKGDTPIANSGVTLPAYGLSYDSSTGGLTLTKNGTAISGQTVSIPDYGSPLTASSAAGMTDTTKVYVYTGETSASLTNGHWYYYDGDSWEDGGTYNSVGIDTDTTLLVSGAAADAKATGDAIDEVGANINIYGYIDKSAFEPGAIASADGTNTDSTTRLRTKGYLNRGVKKINAESGYKYIVAAYDGTDTYLGMWSGDHFVKTGTWLTGETKISVIGASSYNYRIVFSKENNGTIDIDDASNLTLYSVVDKTFAANGVPAEAKAVGDALSGVDNKFDSVDVELYGGTKEVETALTLTANQYYNMNSVFGQGATSYAPSSTMSNTGTYCVKQSVSSGEVYRIYGIGTSNTLGLYILTDSSDDVVSSEKTGSRDTPITLNIEEDGTLYVNLCTYNASTDKVASVADVSINGLIADNEQIKTGALVFAGKKIVNFGDSIFGNFRDTNNTTQKSISKMIADATGATVYNGGFGGCRMSVASEPWSAFSMYSLADSIASGDWSVQDDAIEEDSQSDTPKLPEYFSDTLTMLKAIDFGTVDYITIAYGTNDYSGPVYIKPTDASFDHEWQCYEGALKYSLRTILNAFPKIRIVVISPCWRWFNDAEGAYNYSSDDSQSTNARGYKLPDYADACDDVCKEYHIPYIDNYYNLGFNPYSYTAYFNVKGVDGAVASDDVHPKTYGRQLIADRIVGQMKAMFG